MSFPLISSHDMRLWLQWPALRDEDREQLKAHIAALEALELEPEEESEELVTPIEQRFAIGDIIAESGLYTPPMTKDSPRKRERSEGEELSPSKRPNMRGGATSLNRAIYDHGNATIVDSNGKTIPDGTALPGVLRRKESEPPVSIVGHEIANTLYDNIDIIAKFFHEAFSYDIMTGFSKIPASYKYGKDVINAYWLGDKDQAVFGDGSSTIYNCVTGDLSLVCHEICHGIIRHRCDFTMSNSGESGGLWEAFADVLAIMIIQRHTKRKDFWLICEHLFAPPTKARGFRDLQAPGTAFNYVNDKGETITDASLDHYSKIGSKSEKYPISTVVSHAFYQSVCASKRPSWETVGPVWWESITTLNNSNKKMKIQEFATLTARMSAHGGAGARMAIQLGWKKIGINV
ncbi:zincin [Melanomma pulvis-pyrius CBS 109.77]|uniref:Zincin n=1 Tax=Melanomma pulvis-pyrius CBS 109.77 TaxID=1314802 RepID=A0A6A6XDK0_9PLEO|nr:zincin [Melanomma pulvis-pyrius CBS 109.77]